jgi:hypothetical protein
MTIESVTTHNQPEIDALAEQWLMLKEIIDQNKKALLSIERDLVPLLKSKDEGSATTHTPMGKKIVLKQKTNYRLDGKKLLQIKDQIPADMLPVKVKELLDEPRLKHLRLNEPDTYRLFAQALTATPAKPYVTIEEASDGV